MIRIVETPYLNSCEIRAPDFVIRNSEIQIQVWFLTINLIGNSGFELFSLSQFGLHYFRVII